MTIHAYSMHKWNIMCYIWKTMFNCFWKFPVEKVAVLCRFLDIGAVTKNHLLKYALAHAFCCFLTSVEDVNPAVATRARLLLDTIKRPALQVTSDHVSLQTLQKKPSHLWEMSQYSYKRWHDTQAVLFFRFELMYFYVCVCCPGVMFMPGFPVWHCCEGSAHHSQQTAAAALPEERHPCTQLGVLCQSFWNSVSGGSVTSGL